MDENEKLGWILFSYFVGNSGEEVNVLELYSK